MVVHDTEQTPLLSTLECVVKQPARSFSTFHQMKKCQSRNKDKGKLSEMDIAHHNVWKCMQDPGGYHCILTPPLCYSGLSTQPDSLTLKLETTKCFLDIKFPRANGLLENENYFMIESSFQNSLAFFTGRVIKDMVWPDYFKKYFLEHNPYPHPTTHFQLPYFCARNHL